MPTSEHPIRVLIVDDERFALELLARQLELLDVCAITAFDDAREAVTFLELNSSAIDVVFCDLQMPKMDGVQFIRELARICFAAKLVLVSGEDERILQTAGRLADAYELRVLGVLAKPVSLEALRDVLEVHVPTAIRATRLHPRGYAPSELRRAIATGELLNYYQPKVDIRSGEVRGVEALARWRHPNDGVVSPDQFIAVAEQSGLINQLTMGVLTEALRAASLWHLEGLPLHVAVNVSMDCLGTLDVPDFVERKTQQAGLPTSSLVLEITESRLTKDALKALDILTRLRLKHISLSIDDFGTGQSSLAQLRDFPFNEIKIDRGFVHGACRDTTRAAMVEASLGIARELGIECVGEGVQDRDDWNFLRMRGCDLAQGYFIAMPMPSERIVEWVKAWNRRQRDLALRIA